MLEKIDRIIMLMDFYGPLLTLKQYEALKLHFENDWTLSEMAESKGISRQAVFDLLKRSVESLELYEQQLEFIAKFERSKQVIERMEELLKEYAVELPAYDDMVLLLNELKAIT